jgi:hypothetical protein
MTKRLHIGPGACVISLPGYEAGPATPEIGKAFDMSWPFTGLVLARGLYADPTPMYQSFDYTTRSPDPIILSVPGLRSGYSAYVVIFFPFDESTSVRGQTYTMRGAMASASSISIVRPKTAEGPDRYQRLDGRQFLVFAA